MLVTDDSNDIFGSIFITSDWSPVVPRLLLDSRGDRCFRCPVVVSATESPGNDGDEESTDDGVSPSKLVPSIATIAIETNSENETNVSIMSVRPSYDDNKNGLMSFRWLFGARSRANHTNVSQDTRASGVRFARSKSTTEAGLSGATQFYRTRQSHRFTIFHLFRD